MREIAQTVNLELEADEPAIQKVLRRERTKEAALMMSSLVAGSVISLEGYLRAVSTLIHPGLVSSIKSIDEALLLVIVSIPLFKAGAGAEDAMTSMENEIKYQKTMERNLTQNNPSVRLNESQISAPDGTLIAP